MNPIKPGIYRHYKGNKDRFCQDSNLTKLKKVYFSW
jgi:hypothetical protein